MDEIELTLKVQQLFTASIMSLIPESSFDEALLSRIKEATLAALRTVVQDDGSVVRMTCKNVPELHAVQFMIREVTNAMLTTDDLIRCLPYTEEPGHFEFANNSAIFLRLGK